MLEVKTLQAQLARTEKDPSFNTKQEYIGYAQYMKEKRGDVVFNLATLEMRPKAETQRGRREVHLHRHAPFPVRPGIDGAEAIRAADAEAGAGVAG